MARLLLAGALLMVAVPVQAHTADEIEEWVAEWEAEVYEPDFRLTMSYLAEYRDMVERHQWYFNPQPVEASPAPSSSGGSTAPSGNTGMGSNVEQWRGLVAAHFSDVNRALCLMKYESGGNPNATSHAGARGLLQVMPFWARHLGLAPDALYDPATNLRVAAYVYGQQGWWAWSPYKRGLCR